MYVSYVTMRKFLCLPFLCGVLLLLIASLYLLLTFHYAVPIINQTCNSGDKQLIFPHVIHTINVMKNCSPNGLKGFNRKIWANESLCALIKEHYPWFNVNSDCRSNQVKEEMLLFPLHKYGGLYVEESINCDWVNMPKASQQSVILSNSVSFILAKPKNDFLFASILNLNFYAKENAYTNFLTGSDIIHHVLHVTYKQYGCQNDIILVNKHGHYVNSLDYNYNSVYVTVMCFLNMWHFSLVLLALVFAVYFYIQCNSLLQ